MAERKPRGYWNYETCKEEAKKYKTRREFEHGSGQAYKLARMNGWLNEYTWFELKWEKKWNKDTCREEARKYKSRGDFGKGNASAYASARKNGWLDEYDWFEQNLKPSGFWNYETCKEEARKYRTRTAFNKGSSGAYEVALKNGWIDEYDWFEQKTKIRGFWNYNTCKKEASQYKSRSEFKKGCGHAYYVALKNGWIDEYEWFYDRITWNFDTCKKEADKFKSRTEFKKGCSGAFRVASKNGWLDIFFGEKTSKPNGYWDIYENCKTEAQKYETRNEFHNRNYCAYESCQKHGWLDAFFGVRYVRSEIYTYEVCKKIASNYKNRNAMCKGDRPAYQESLKQNWLDDFFGNLNKLPNGYWNYQKCWDEAKKYHTRGDYRDGCGSAYASSLINGWLNDYIWFDAPDETYKKGDTFFVYLYLWEELKTVYIGKSHRKQGRLREHSSDTKSSVFKFTSQHNLKIPEPIYLEENLTNIQSSEREKFFIAFYKDLGYTLLNKAPGGGSGSYGMGKWTYDKCKEIASKYKRRRDLELDNHCVYDACCRNRWIDDFFPPKTTKECGYWTYERCKAEAEKYNSRSEFSRNNHGAFYAAYREKWLDDFYPHLISKPKGYWNYNRCKEESKKYNSKGSFKKSNNSAYSAALKNGWLDEYDWLKKKK